MDFDRGPDVVLTTLTDGVRVLSTLLGDQSPPRHVYRVVAGDGTLMQEFPSLADLNDFVSRFKLAATIDRTP